MVMGPTHAMSGAAVGLAVAQILPEQWGGVTTAEETFIYAGLAAGAALLPDLDAPSATVSRSFGPVTQVISRFTENIAQTFVNVTRGEIAPEGELLKVWENGNLFGIGLDVFSGEAGLTKVLRGEKEPETENEKAGAFFIRSAIDRTANIYVQPHQAFNSDVAALCKAEETIRHLEAYYRNGQKCFDSQLPYYL